MSSDHEAVEAALLWDVPALRRLGVGGEAFVEAFMAGGAAKIWWKSPPAEDDVLSIAAAAVRSERRGEAAAAVERYDRLDNESPWVRLLAACLRAWSPSGGGRETIDAAALIGAELQPEGPLAPWLHCRLMTCAYDHSLVDLVDDHLRAAIESASEFGQLRMVLVGERTNLLGEYTELSDIVGRRLSELPHDELVFRRWIDAAALSSAQDHLGQALVDRAQGPWRATLRIGRGPLDELLAADLQATWCGALWQRRPVRQQLAAAALLNEPRDSEQAAWALWMWLDARGREIERVSDLVEPQLVEADIDELLRSWSTRVAPEESRLMGLARLANTFWDRCSTDVATWLLEAVPVGAGRHPVFDEGRRALNHLGRRLPELYENRIAGLSQELHADLADDLSSLEVAALTDASAQALLEALGPDGDQSTRVLLRQRLGRSASAIIRSVEGSRPSDLILAAAIDRQAVSVDGVKAALGRLIDDIANLRTEAREGKHPMGGNVPKSVAQGLLLLDADDPLVRAGVEALLELAEDSTISGEERVRALGALARAGWEGRLSNEDRARIRSAPTTSDAVEMFATSADRMEAIRLLALAPALEDSERARLVSLGRSSDPTARHAAVNAAGLARHAESNEMLTWIVLSALFDPAEDVVAKGVEAIDLAIITHPAYGPLTVERLAALQANRGRRTRTAIAACLQRVTAGGTHAIDDLAPLVDAACHDGSWLVRQAIMSGPEGLDAA